MDGGEKWWQLINPKQLKGNMHEVDVLLSFSWVISKGNRRSSYLLRFIG
jgi:hypothetical protein